MSWFNTSRFTAVLATVAILGTAGSLSWAIVYRADMKSDTPVRSADRGSQPKYAGRALRSKDERAHKLASALRGERVRSISSDWSDDRGQLRERSIAVRSFMDDATLRPQGGGPDMPLPSPPITLSSLEGGQFQSTVPQTAAPQLAAENQKRPLREPKPERTAAAMPNSPKPAARSFYVEKIVEQGDAGEVKFRYRRQPCAPPNMPDVCFMPQESRRGIVVERH